MSQQNLFFMFIVCTSLFLIVQMYSIHNNLDEFDRYQRGFGNRRALVNHLRHHYPKESLFESENQDNLRNDKHLLLNPYQIIEQEDVMQQQQQPSLIYR